MALAPLQSRPWWSRARYMAATALFRPNARILDDYFRERPDPYRMAENGDDRMIAIARAIEEQAGGCESILDVACHEGYVLDFVARQLGVREALGLDISEVALARARERCGGFNATFRIFDLNALYRDGGRLPATQPYDVVLVCEVLYCVGPFANHLWSWPKWQFGRKVRLLRAFQQHARKLVVVQHFGLRQRDAIGAIAAACGGRLVDAQWGVYCLDGAAEA